MTVGGTKLSKEISLGNLLSMLTMIVGLAIGWQTIVSTTTANATAISKLDQRLTKAEEKVDNTLTTIAGDRVELTKALTELQADLRYLRQAVDKLQASR